MGAVTTELVTIKLTPLLVCVIGMVDLLIPLEDEVEMMSTFEDVTKEAIEDEACAGAFAEEWATVVTTTETLEDEAEEACDEGAICMAAIELEVEEAIADKACRALGGVNLVEAWESK